jgi:urease accessory protein
VLAACALPPTWPTWPLRWPPFWQAPRAREVLLAFAWGWAENMVQAAIKAVPLGQSAGQRMLARLDAGHPAGRGDRAWQLPDR